MTRIAARQGVGVQALLKANPGLNPQRLQIGQRLNVPVTAGSGKAVVKTAGLRVRVSLPLVGRLTTAPSNDHLGLDIAARSGTAVRAAMGGTVQMSEFDGRTGWGWTVVVDHGNGYTTRYSHNSANLVRVGQQVTAGQTIARVGSTGNSTGPHLDFRVYREGQAVNPYSLYE
ncbi:murein DD-endopeptidase MepM/ murein hydrolase activator NlpD [Deinococcus metalli]|uniref:Murein DD-endopeptidase MepM/ murein hydrolase activator NlpD n=1 Tax=Deinococcus metalli TaxID=1141878 RepID=A0A7W8KHX3_9DEIO|nr:murein DD-endopeptidase MepM/ murein hydrolase activator NlpD [Deinococcus metalli]